MDVQSCRAFLEAVNTGTFAGAAKNLGYTTPGISHLVTGLENELGFALLYRKPRGVKPTPIGELFIPYAEEYLEREQRIFRFAQDVKNLAVGRVRIGAYPSLAAHVLPRVLKAFRSDYPGVDVEVEECSHFHLLEDAAEGIYDLVFLTQEDPLFENAHALLEDELVVALPKNHPAANQKAFPVAKLGAESLLIQGLYKEGRNAEQFFQKHGFGVETAVSGLSSTGMLGMVKEGLAVGLLNRLSATHWEEEVAILPLSPPITITICVATGPAERLSSAAARFLDITLACFGKEETR